MTGKYGKFEEMCIGCYLMIEYLAGLTLEESGRDWRIGGVEEMHGAGTTGEGDNGHLMFGPYFELST